MNMSIDPLDHDYSLAPESAHELDYVAGCARCRADFRGGYSGQLNAVYSVDELEDEDIDDMIGR